LERREKMMEAGIWVIAMCLVIITILTVLDYFGERDDDNE
jgi:preprotein translocase subunit SecE